MEHADVLSDLCARPTRAKLCGRSGWVHAGMFAAARHLLEVARAPLAAAAQRAAGWPLLITGHSMGGECERQWPRGSQGGADGGVTACSPCSAVSLMSLP